MISDEIRRYQMLDEEIEPHGNSPNSTALGHDQPLWLPLVSPEFKEFSSRWMSGVGICVEEADGAPPGAPSTNSTPDIFPGGGGTDAPWSRFLSSLASVLLTLSLLESMRTVIPSSVQDSFSKLQICQVISFSFSLYSHFPLQGMIDLEGLVLVCT